MYKKALCWLVVFILLSTSFSLKYQSEESKVNTLSSRVLIVGTGMTYESIQDAINDSKAGDSIYVYSGTYFESLNITKSITLIGADKENTAICKDKNRPSWNINITADNVIIQNFTINNTRWGYSVTGLTLFGVEDCSLNNNIISVGYSTGIRLYDSKNITVENNIIVNNWHYGILIENSEFITIKNNNLTENEEIGLAVISSNNNRIMDNNITNNYWNGLSLENSSNNIIVNNTVSRNFIGIRNMASKNNSFHNNSLLGNGFVIRGEELAHWNSHQMDESNTVNGRTFYYWRDRDNGSIPPNAGQIILANCSNITIENQNLSYCSECIILGFSNNNILKNNSISSWYWGRHGIVLYKADKNMLTNNHCFWNYYYGIYLNHSNDNILINNICIENSKGIFVKKSHNNVLFNNTAALNSEENLELVNSNNITLENNNFTSYQETNPNVPYWSQLRNVVFRESRNITLKNNTLNRCGINIYGELEHWDSHYIDNSNMVNGKPIYYYKNQEGIQISMEVGELILANCTNMEIKNINTSYINSGILVGFCSKITISNNSFSNNYYGIHLAESNFNKIENNSCCNNTYGIFLDNSNNNIIKDNYCSSNNLDGIQLVTAENNTITRNMCDSNNCGIWFYGVKNNLITNNNCDSNYLHGLMFYQSEFNNVSKNKCINNSFGIRVYYSKNSSIENNMCVFNRNIGIDIQECEFLRIKNNILNSNVNIGIKYHRGNNYSIENNTINFNNGIGIRLSSCNNGEINGNILYKNHQVNIQIIYSNNINISNNDIVLSNYTGISLDGANNNTISENNIIANGYVGISIDRNSNFNSIFSNNIMNFDYQAKDDSKHNHWNLSYPRGGNYWGDYQGMDNYLGLDQDFLGSDGFGDTPYKIPGGPTGTLDSYPLMEPTSRINSLKIPLAPRNLTAIPYGKSVVISWSPPEHTGGNITGYNIYRCVFDDRKELIAKVRNATTYIDDNIREKWVYYYNVTAENEFGEGPSSEEINITPVFKPKPNEQNIIDTLNPLRCAMGIILVILAIIFIINMLLTRRKLKKSQELEKNEPKIDADNKVK